MPPNVEHAVEIAPRVWWVGHRQDHDPFQCHAYLLEQGEQSVLIDPGSMRTFEHTLRKIREVVPFDHIRTIIAQHQDPDVVACLPALAAMIRRTDARLVTHWRSDMLLKHYDDGLPRHLVDQEGWRLQLEDRCLEFVFTPYAHFAGAFCSFDPVSRVMFSSDIFGALDEDFQLFAQDADHFERMRPFHEHYMPSREILDFALTAIARCPFDTIAPQHGSILRDPLAHELLERLRHLDCGLYLLAGRNSDVHRLYRLNATLREITRTLSLYRDFRDIAGRLLEVMQRSLPARALRFLALDPDGAVVSFQPETRFRGELAPPESEGAALLGLDREAWNASGEGISAFRGATFAFTSGPEGQTRVTLPLFTPTQGLITALATVELSARPEDMDELAWIAEQLALPLQVALEREMILRELDQQRQEIYERSIRDPLTGLFTRVYMQDAVARLSNMQDRGSGGDVCLALLDIDHFKRVNDTWGHNQGDLVLRAVGRALLAEVRESDLAIRFGGEELAVFSVGLDARAIAALAERLRLSVAALRFAPPMADSRLTVSVGTALRRPGEALEELVERADHALYAAKEGGRNRVCAG